MTEMMTKKLSLIVKSKMALKSISPKELAEKTGLHVRYVYDILKGKHSPALKTMMLISNALGYAQLSEMIKDAEELEEDQC